MALMVQALASRILCTAGGAGRAIRKENLGSDIRRGCRGAGPLICKVLSSFCFN